jgi:hypothetical protein
MASKDTMGGIINGEIASLISSKSCLTFMNKLPNKQTASNLTQKATQTHPCGRGSLEQTKETFELNLMSKYLVSKKEGASPSISDIRDFVSLAGSSDISEIKKNTEEKRFKES